MKEENSSAESSAGVDITGIDISYRKGSCIYLSIGISIGPMTMSYIVVIHAFVSLSVRPSMQSLTVLTVVSKSTLVKPFIDAIDKEQCR